jgi:hypothetical protein
MCLIFFKLSIDRLRPHQLNQFGSEPFTVNVGATTCITHYNAEKYYSCLSIFGTFVSKYEALRYL